LIGVNQERMAVSNLTQNQQFFYDNAGFSYDPKTQTPEEGRRECALKLAEAEDVFIEAHRLGKAECRWEMDEFCLEEFPWDDEGEAYMMATLVKLFENGSPKGLTCLGGISDADTKCRRVIRAELALERLEELRELLSNPEKE
jgi:hypothetical protein